LSEIEFLGMLVLSLVTLIGLFAVVFKPLNANTKAMAELVSRLDIMTLRMDERDEELKEHIKEFDKYKEKVRESQKRQWDKIDELSDDMIKVKHNCGMEGGNKGV